MKDSDAVGPRIAKIRKMRGLSQHQLAAISKVSYSMITKVERGHATPSPGVIGMIAQALRVDASKIYGDDNEEERVLDIVPIIRRTLAATDLMPDDIEPVPLNLLTTQVTQVMDWRRATRYRKVAEVLPDLVDQLLVSGQEVGEPAYALLTDAYRAANSLAHKFGYADLSLTATERMEWAATKSGDPLRLATAHFVKASTLARIGATPQAMRLLDRSIADIEPLIADDASAAAVYSSLHMKAGTIAATLGDTDGSAMHFTEAVRLAARVGDRVVYDTVVGPTNVRIYQVAAETDLGRPEKALEIARSTTIPGGMAHERKTYFWLDSARAHLLSGDPDAAIEALYESRSVAPEHFRNNPTVRATIRTVAEQQRRANDTLRSLANSAGIMD